jgi:uncharacterized protein YbbK (DUF523 family)
MYLVSACLAGFNTRYDGTNSIDERIRRLIFEGRAIPVCPEQLAGLSTPRTPIEFRGGDGKSLLEGKTKAVGADSADYSSVLIRGAEESLRIAKLYGIKEAVLKDGSPSCGVTYVYSEGVRIPGRGVTAEMLRRNGIKVKTVDSL